MEKTKKQFEYTKKDTYTQEEVDKLFTDLLGYHKVDELYAENKQLNTKIETLNGELSPYKSEKFGKTVKGFLPENFKEGAYKDFITVSGITDEDDDDAIKTKIKAGLKGRDYFLNKENEQQVPPEKQGKVVVEEETPKRKNRFLA